MNWHPFYDIDHLTRNEVLVRTFGLSWNDIRVAEFRVRILSVHFWKFRLGVKSVTPAA